MRYTVPPGTALSAAALSVAAVLALTDFSSLRTGADPWAAFGGRLGVPGELDAVVTAVCGPDVDSALAAIAVAPIAPAATPAASTPIVSAARLRFLVGGRLGTSFTMQVSFGRPDRATPSMRAVATMCRATSLPRHACVKPAASPAGRSMSTFDPPAEAGGSKGALSLSRSGLDHLLCGRTAWGRFLVDPAGVDEAQHGQHHHHPGADEGHQ